MSHRIGIDIGGTFTDFTILRDDGSVFLWKQDSTPARPVEAIETGLSNVAEALGTDVGSLLKEAELMVHGTTIATNTLIQRNGPRVGLLCTDGFRDVLYFRNGYKPHRFDIHHPHPEDFVERWLRLGVRERFNHKGEELEPLNEEDVRAAAAKFRDADVKSVAVAFLWSMVKPEHELRAAEILAEELPGVPVVCSHVVLPEIREWQRTSATVLSSYILPGIAEYLGEFETQMNEQGLGSPPLIMQITGGCARVDDIIERPVSLLASGPAAAPAAALHYARGVGDDLITVDMGGTSLDVCVITGGVATMSRDIEVEDQPIGIPAVECHSIGAGGGSIAWIDKGGALRVGPRSAGARPGPAAYGFGGTEPTVTDANVALGYLQPSAFLGGRRDLRDDLSREAIKTHVADPLGLSVDAAAAGILRVVNANMVAAIRVMSVERGVDPRRFTLVSGGGAGSLHAADLAAELGIEKVLVPAEAGTFCAFGMTVTDVRHDFAAASHLVTDRPELDRINEVLARLENEARTRLAEEGFSEDQIRIERHVDARYPGQVYEITVPVAATGELTEADIPQVETAFHDAHEKQFTYSRRSLPIECLHWRVVAFGQLPVTHEEARAVDSKEATPTGTARCYDATTQDWVEASTFDGAALEPGDVIEGPAIVQSSTTTVKVPANARIEVRSDGNLMMHLNLEDLKSAQAEEESFVQ